MTHEFPAEALNSALSFMESVVEAAGHTNSVRRIHTEKKSEGTRWRLVSYLGKHDVVLARFKVESVQVGEGLDRKYRIIVTILGPPSLLSLPTSIFQHTTPEPSEPSSPGSTTDDQDL